MRKSKLENYEDLLSALMDRYVGVDSLAFKCNMDCLAVNTRLEFLIANHLVVIENTKGLNKYLEQISIKDLNPLLN